MMNDDSKQFITDKINEVLEKQRQTADEEDRLEGQLKGYMKILKVLIQMDEDKQPLNIPPEPPEPPPMRIIKEGIRIVQ